MRSYAAFNNRLAKRYDQWMVAMKYADHTKHQYQLGIKTFLAFIGKKSLTNVTHLDVREFMARLSNDGASLHGVYRHLTILRVFFDFLNLGGVVSYVAPRIVQVRHPRRNPLPIMTEEQARRLIAAARTPRERALLEFLYSTGCRLKEASHLMIENLNLDARRAVILGKFGKARTVLLTPESVDALKAYLGNRTTGLVFRQELRVQKGFLSFIDGQWYAIWRDYSGPGPNYPRRRRNLGRIELVGREEAQKKFDALMAHASLVAPVSDHRPMTNIRLQEIVRRIGLRAGLKNITPHMIRRSLASHLYDNGASVEVIQRLLGHVFLQTTLIYVRQSTGQMEKSFERCHPRMKMHEQPAAV